jgi:O-antigen/teichoic acid export membrane protein
VRGLLLYSGLYAGSAAALKLLTFVLFLWLARTLSVEQFASWSIFYSFQTAVTAFGVVGIVESTVGLMRGAHEHGEQQRLFLAARSVFVVVCAASILIVTASFVGVSGMPLRAPLTTVFVIASGALLAYASLQAQIVRLEERHLASLSFAALLPLAGFAGSLVAFAMARTVESFYLGATLGLAAALVAAACVAPELFKFRIDVAAWHPLLSRIPPFVAVTLLGWLGGYGNNFIIEHLFDLREVAAFTFVLMLSSVMQLVATAMNQVWSPRFYQLLRASTVTDLGAQDRRFFLLQGLALGAAGAVLIVAFPVGVHLIGGNAVQYMPYADGLLMMVLAYVLLTPWYQCQNYFLAHDMGPSVMNILLVTGAIGIALWIALMDLLGPFGIYVGFLLQMALRSAGAYVVARRRWRVKISWLGMTGGAFLVLAASSFRDFF